MIDAQGVIGAVVLLFYDGFSVHSYAGNIEIVLVLITRKDMNTVVFGAVWGRGEIVVIYFYGNRL